MSSFGSEVAGCRRRLDGRSRRSSSGRPCCFGSLKTKPEEDGPFETRQAALFEFTEGTYNRQLLHSAVSTKTPAELKQLAAAA